MNYLKKSFTVTGDLAGVSAYRKNWERVFGKRKLARKARRKP